MSSCNKLRIVLPGHCQLMCKVCHNEHNSDLFISNLFRLISTVNQITSVQDIEHVNITGGEPFHVKNINSTKDIVGYLKQKLPKSILSINTNAVDISNDTAKWIGHNCNYIKISLYGTTDLEYKLYSNIACYNRVVSNIDKLSKIGVKINLNVVATKQLLNNNCILRLFDIATKYADSIKFVELISHEWFSVSKINDYHSFYLSPQLLLNELIGHGAIPVTSDFNRDVLSYNGLRVESYRYPTSAEHAFLFYNTGWGVFLRSDGQICTLFDSSNLSIATE